MCFKSVPILSLVFCGYKLSDNLYGENDRIPEMCHTGSTKRERHGNGDDDEIVDNHTEEAVIRLGDVHDDTNDDTHNSNNLIEIIAAI